MNLNEYQHFLQNLQICQDRKNYHRHRDAKSEEHEERVPAIFPPAVLIFELPTQKIC